MTTEADGDVPGGGARGDGGGVGADLPPVPSGRGHASRLAQEALLRDPSDRSAHDELRRSYDAMAGEWTPWAAEHPDYVAPVAAGLDVARPGRGVVELCCGTGQATTLLAERRGRVLAVDAVPAMLAQVPSDARVTCVVADVARLPLADASVTLVVGLNAVLLPRELARVVAPGGQVLWCTSFADDTPLYVPPDAVRDHLDAVTAPGTWTLRQGRAGRGEWALLTRQPGGEGGSGERRERQ